MRIAFCGSQGTGKSTLVPLLSKKFNIPVMNKTTQEVMDEFGFKSQDDVLSDPGKTGIYFQTAMIKSRHDFFKEKNLTGQTNYITDRTPLDSWAYFLVHNSYYATDEQSEHLYKLVKESSEYFDYVFTLSPGLFQVEDNGVRNTKIFYQKTIQTVIEHNALDVGFKLIQVPQSVLSIEDRVEWIYDYVKTYEETKKAEKIGTSEGRYYEDLISYLSDK